MTEKSDEAQLRLWNAMVEAEEQQLTTAVFELDRRYRELYGGQIPPGCNPFSGKGGSDG